MNNRIGNLLLFAFVLSIAGIAVSEECAPRKQINKNGIKTEIRTTCLFGDKYTSEFQNGKRNGEAIAYFRDGRVQSISLYREDLKEDSTMVWDSLGNLRSKRYYHRGKPVGIRKSWDESGRLSTLTTFDSLGQKHGLDADWWPDGKKKSESYYASGVCTLAVEYYRNGVKSEVYRYLNEPHTEAKPHITLSGESWSWSGKSIAKIRNGNGMAIRLPRSMDSLSHPDNGGVMLIYKDSINQKIIPLDSAKMMKYR